MHVDTPQTRCRAGVARGDITPPVGIYHRMWGAATHDRATAVHRPLLATLLWLQAPNCSATVGQDSDPVERGAMTGSESCPTSNSADALLIIAPDHPVM